MARILDMLKCSQKDRAWFLCTKDNMRHRQTSYLVEAKEDLTAPIFSLHTFDETSSAMHDADATANRFLLNERETKGRRVKIRVAFEVWARGRTGVLAFSRLRGKHVMLSAPNGRQAAAVVELVRQVCAQLEGKFLAEVDDLPVPEPTAPVEPPAKPQPPAWMTR